MSVYSETRTTRTWLNNPETDKEKWERRGDSIMTLCIKWGEGGPFISVKL